MLGVKREKASIKYAECPLVGTEFQMRDRHEYGTLLGSRFPPTILTTNKSGNIIMLIIKRKTYLMYLVVVAMT